MGVWVAKPPLGSKRSEREECHHRNGKKGAPAFEQGAPIDGGAEGTRTPDPHTASVVRYQLRHGPIFVPLSRALTE
jgi:hypothetical protein